MAAKEAAARLEGGQVRLCQELSDVHSDRDAWRSEVERLILIEYSRNERERLPWWKRLAGWAPTHLRAPCSLFRKRRETITPQLVAVHPWILGDQ